ncbi:hypothetical protein [Streptomyces sp. NPDC091027]|uniref:hypothetical protein n=1 Tax=Streptomyces sp. NPDC091027 TaxID=3365971 RepID=UPI0037F76C43
MATNLELFADYFQIHLMDDDSEATETGIGDVWTEQAVLDGLGVGEHALAIGTAVNVFVEVAIDLLSGRPDDDSGDFDHVVEASLNLASGRLVVAGCTEHLPDAARFDMPAGWTRVRTSRRNLQAAAFPDPECEDEPEDKEEIRIQVWPALHSQPDIIKRWTPPNA